MLIYDRAHLPPTVEDCHTITYAEQRLNCDPSARTSNLCVGGRFNEELKKLVFDGSSSCGELNAAVALKYGTDWDDSESY
jgi:hypothetical protein